MARHGVQSEADVPGARRSRCSEAGLRPIVAGMVWFYERKGSFLRFETRDVEDRAGMFELVVLQPDGKECVERFANSETLLQRQQELETSLGSRGWQGPYGRFF